MIVGEAWRRIRYWRTVDRIGPDVPYTHWRLHLRSTMRRLCAGKFKYFGEGAEVRPGAYVVTCSNISLGKRVIIRPGTMLFADEFEGIVVEDDVMLGAGVHIYVNNHRFDRRDISIIDQGYYPSQPVRLEKGCWIGANAILLPGVVIGKNSVVGAGSIVTRSVPAYVVAVGSPARLAREIGASKLE